MNRLKQLFSKDLFSAAVNYSIRLLVKPVSMLLIPLLMSGVEQGYWYTFVSLAAFTMFVDLGFTNIITQFAAHEAAHCDLSQIGVQEDTAFSRMASLFRFILKWLCSAMGLFIPVIFVIGCVIFSKEGTFQDWGGAWLLYCVATAFHFIIQALLSFFEGCQQIYIAQRIKAVEAVVLNVSYILLLLAGGGLYSLGIGLILTGIVDLLLMALAFHKFLRVFLRTESEKIPWVAEILPLLKRYALSWISGYLIFQIYNPLAFSLFGAEVAGRVGFSITILSSICSLATVWINIIIPKLNLYAEQRQWAKMDGLLRVYLPMNSLTYCIGYGLFSALLCIPGLGGLFLPKLLDNGQMLLLFVAYFFQIITNGLAVYLRANKQEPYMWISVAGACISLSTTLVLMRYFGQNFLFVGYLMSVLCTFPIAVRIFIHKRREYMGSSE